VCDNLLCLFSFQRYDHLADLLTRVLQERPNNPVDVLEDLSKEEKRKKLSPINDSIIPKVDHAMDFVLAEKQRTLFSVCLYVWTVCLFIVVINNLSKMLGLNAWWCEKKTIIEGKEKVDRWYKKYWYHDRL